MREPTFSNTIDLIERDKVLDALRTCFDTESYYDEGNGGYYIKYEDAVGAVEELSSFKNDTDTKRYSKDVVNRQAAIDAADCECQELRGVFGRIEEALKKLPSAKPEPLTEAEVIICKMYLDDLDKHKTCNEYKLLMGLLDGTASAQPEQRWIPVEERLPEKNGLYLTWMRFPYEEEPTWTIENYDADVEAFGEWREHYHPETLGYLDSEFEEIENVTAWMPLPSPYREDGGE